MDKLIDRSVAAIGGGGGSGGRPIDREDDDRRARSSYPSDRPNKYARDDEYTKRRRKKSFQGELFDFD